VLLTRLLPSSLTRSLSSLSPLSLPAGDAELGLPLPHVCPPYHSIQVIFNHENVWANLQALDPLKCLYEIDTADQWKPFCSFEDGFTLESTELVAFYKPPTIPARLKRQRADKMRDQVLAAVKEGVTYIREQRMLDIKIHEPQDPHHKAEGDGPKHMQDTLSVGLKLMEDRLLANDNNKRDTVVSRLSSWKGQLIKSSPPNVSFEGIPVNFSYCDGKKIKNRLCEKYEEFLLDPEPDVVFCFGCYVAPYYCSVNSTWVYVGKMRDLEEEEDEE